MRGQLESTLKWIVFSNRNYNKTKFMEVISMEIIVKILNEQGLHARPASIFVKTANKFKSSITIIHGADVANAKSIINIMSLGLSKNEEIKIIVEGTDEKEAIEALKLLVESKFGED